MVEIDNKVTTTNDDIHIAKDLNVKQLRKCQDALQAASKEIDQELSRAKDVKKGKRKIWEADGGNSELTKELRQRGHQARSFGAHNGWDFSKPSIQKKFLNLIDEEQPDDIWISP
eukprot:7090037-Pyramimonas_sp.AAC.1